LYGDLYGNSKKGSQGDGFPFQKPSKSSKIQNLGIPSSEYIKITDLNEKFESYDFSLLTAMKSKAFAAAKYCSKSFDRALQLALTGDTDLPAYAKSQLLEAEKTFLKKGMKLVGTLQALEGQLASVLYFSINPGVVLSLLGILGSVKVFSVPCFTNILISLPYSTPTESAFASVV
jgi:hypothetical protein